MRTETLGEEPNHWSIGKIRERERKVQPRRCLCRVEAWTGRRQGGGGRRRLRKARGGPLQVPWGRAHLALRRPWWEECRRRPAARHWQGLRRRKGNNGGRDAGRRRRTEEGGDLEEKGHDRRGGWRGGCWGRQKLGRYDHHLAFFFSKCEALDPSFCDHHFHYDQKKT